MKMGCCALSFLLALVCVQGGRGTSVIERVLTINIIKIISMYSY